MTKQVDSDARRNIIAIAAIALCVYVPAVSAQAADSLSGTTDTVNTVGAISDDIDGLTVDATGDTTVNTAGTNSRGKKKIDAVNLDDDELLQAALAVDSVKTAPSAQKLDLIRREHEYKKQTRAAIIMMIFITAAMATSQSWNPR